MKFTKKLKEKMEDHDMFGYSVSLNFDKKGDSHNTWIGGFFSLFIKLFMVIFISFKVKKLAFREGSSTSSSTFPTKVDTMGEVNWNSTHITYFYVIKEQAENFKPLYLNHPDLDKYVDIYFA